jgi:hypothetical protein
MSNNGIHRRVEALEVRVRPRQSEPPSNARERMKAHLDQLGALRRGELSDEEAAEVEAVNTAVERRFREFRGEGQR